jgi:hypothetical protein
MFYEQLNAALNGDRSEGWLKVSKHLNLSQQQLQTKIEQESLTFEECIIATKASSSPELLTYVMRLFDQTFRGGHERRNLN